MTVESGKPESGGDIVVCSLEAWDDVWRRNQFLVEEFLQRDPTLRVLFVEPVVDVPYEIAHRRRPGRAGLREVGASGHLWALRPRKFVPRLLAPGMSERHLAQAVLTTASRLGLEQPLLWVNDAVFAQLAEQVGWPVVYDVTDDWLLAGGTRRALKRLRSWDAKLLRRSDEVVVVSPALIPSRGGDRPVHVIGCAVDVGHFREPRARPVDLPPAPVVVYVGTQHDRRLDIDLCVKTAQAIAPATFVLVGPNFLEPHSTHRLLQAGCRLLAQGRTQRSRPITGTRTWSLCLITSTPSPRASTRSRATSA